MTCYGDNGGGGGLAFLGVASNRRDGLPRMVLSALLFKVSNGSYRLPKTHPYRYAMSLLHFIKASSKATPGARKQIPLLHGDHTAKECTYQDMCNQWPYFFSFTTKKWEKVWPFSLLLRIMLTTSPIVKLCACAYTLMCACGVCH